MLFAAAASLGISPSDEGFGLAIPDELPSLPPELRETLDTDLRIRGLVFVGTRPDGSEFVLRSREAYFEPQTNVAHLEEVHITASDAAKDRSFEVRCDHGELNLDTNDFRAEGNVRGSTGDGQSYRASWVRYDHEQGLLYTDAPVTLTDETGSFSGDGFRYHVKEKRFRMIGNVELVQRP